MGGNGERERRRMGKKEDIITEGRIEKGKKGKYTNIYKRIYWGEKMDG